MYQLVSTLRIILGKIAASYWLTISIKSDLEFAPPNFKLAASQFLITN
jgi:hypothetical protein